MTITVRVEDKTTRDEIKKKYPCVELGNHKLKVTIDDPKKILKEFKNIWP